jgi:hypothetical protein
MHSELNRRYQDNSATPDVHHFYTDPQGILEAYNTLILRSQGNSSGEQFCRRALLSVWEPNTFPLDLGALRDHFGTSCYKSAWTLITAFLNGIDLRDELPHEDQQQIEALLRKERMFSAAS